MYGMKAMSRSASPAALLALVFSGSACALLVPLLTASYEALLAAF